MNVPGTYDLTVYKGADFSLAATWRDGNQQILDLSGYAAKLQCRSSATANDLLLELSTANGRITLSGVSPNIALFVQASDTEALDWTQGVYDLRLTAGDGSVTRLLGGYMFVSPDVTR